MISPTISPDVIINSLTDLHTAVVSGFDPFIITDYADKFHKNLYKKLLLIQ